MANVTIGDLAAAGAAAATDKYEIETAGAASKYVTGTEIADMVAAILVTLQNTFTDVNTFSSTLTVNADLVFAANTQGPILVDRSNGHTYRLKSTAGVLTLEQVT